MHTISLRKINIGRTLLIPALLTIMAFLIIKPARYMESMRSGLVVFVSSVLPALFPFFFVTRLLTSLGMGEGVSVIMRRPMAQIYHAPPLAGYILLMCLMSGYPIGAKLLSSAYENGLIDENEVRRIMPMTSLPGPIFIVGTLSTGLLHDSSLGYIILVSCIMGALLNGLVYRGKTMTHSGVKSYINAPIKDTNILANTIDDSVMSILVVGGYIAIFYVLSDILLDLGLLSIPMTLLSLITEELNLSTAYAQGMSLSLIEMTRGILMFGNDTNTFAKCVIASGIVSFGGLAILMQSMTYLSKAKIKVSYYLLTKLTQSAFTLIISMILSSIYLI